MRIISGTLKGRKLDVPNNNWKTRPTTDYAREALYNILANRLDFDGLEVLDLFGGTGAHSFECLSRGAHHVTYVEKYTPCVNFVLETAQRFGMTESISCHRQDAFSFLENCTRTYDYIFADPPYDHPRLSLLPALIFGSPICKEGSIFVLEHDRANSFVSSENLVTEKKYGQTLFSFFKTGG